MVKKVSIDTFERIEESVYVESVECLGDSGIYYGYTWYSVVLSPAYEMSGNIIIGVYVKREVRDMRVIVFKTNEYKAVLSDGHKPIITNYYNDIKDVYDFAAWACETYSTTIDVVFR